MRITKKIRARVNRGKLKAIIKHTRFWSTVKKCSSIVDKCGRGSYLGFPLYSKHNRCNTKAGHGGEQESFNEKNNPWRRI